MQPFRNLKVWQRSHGFALEVYQLTRRFPSEERFALADQMRRCAVSVPSNIAEGSVYDQGEQFNRYLTIALASATELEYQLLLAHDLEYLPGERYQLLDAELAEIKRMLVAFRNYRSGRPARTSQPNSQQLPASSSASAP